MVKGDRSLIGDLIIKCVTCSKKLAFKEILEFRDKCSSCWLAAEKAKDKKKGDNNGTKNTR